MMPRRSCDETGALGPASAERLGRDRAQHPLPVSEGAQVALAMDAVEFKTGHLGDRQARLCDTHCQEGLNLKAVTPDTAAVSGLGLVRVR